MSWEFRRSDAERVRADEEWPAETGRLRCRHVHPVRGRCVLEVVHPVGPMYPGDHGHMYRDDVPAAP